MVSMGQPNQLMEYEYWQKVDYKDTDQKHRYILNILDKNVYIVDL